MANLAAHKPTTAQGDVAATVPHPTSNSSSKEPLVVPVPETREGRTLVLCFDGTGAQFDEDISQNSNIVRLFQMLHKGEPLKQKIYYQAGIGTGITTSGSANKYVNEFYGLVDAAFANGLPIHVGLLPSHNYEQIKFAYRHFKQDDVKGRKQSEEFMKAFSIKVKVDFVGVFDTVGSVGFVHRELPFTRSNSLIRVFRHALALDERRANFDANLWSRSAKSRGKHYGWIAWMKSLVWRDNNANHGQAEECDGPDKDDQWYGHDFGRPVNTNIKEVWFAGAHGDVGGGAVLNRTPNDLARIPLRWMVLECFRNDTGILFKSAELKKIGLNPATLINFPAVPEPKLIGLNEDGSPHYGGGDACKSADVLSRITEDKKDAIQPTHDRLDISWQNRNIMWWILELLPIKQWYQNNDGNWESRWRWMNLGRPRTIYRQEFSKPHVHWSVEYRKRQPEKKYKPLAGLLDWPGPEWVD
ncbi:hypothetical protein RhiXN_09479 [Rhizoctonia solani]|uniref:T6SS Phospholipase effector Tle1-like catalytic domain-containing protein n=1 Tax=Rhizoctonia solani TaxID=456999 RepID=A0A8H8SWL9_9AGAM|nr:uncharacterized protein RhiXN_09479 [Rhizoctonia solani]QRW20504.1 hypothetical protein RhiXN_09479 [Rhizoctonia solani]